jgi:hypothetical protein
MGAYSSWAMLALTHHVLVRVAAQRCGVQHFKDYIVLGDDIVIQNDKVASEYLFLMKCLGVKINLSKSIISSRFCEFAKRWKGPGYELTPIGPGLVLRLVRSKYYLNIFVMALLRLRLLTSLYDIRDLLKRREIHTMDYSSNEIVLWTSLGLSGILHKSFSHDTSLDESIEKCFSYVGLYTPSSVHYALGALNSLRIKEKAEALKTFDERLT